MEEDSIVSNEAEGGEEERDDEEGGEEIAGVIFVSFRVLLLRSDILGLWQSATEVTFQQGLFDTTELWPKTL